MKHCVYLFSEGRVDFFVVLVGLVIIFKDQITDIVENLFNGITNKTGEITG